MSVTVKIDSRTKAAKILLEYLRTLSFVKVEEEKAENVYDAEFVKMVKESAASKKRYEVDPNDVWGSLELK